MLWTLSPFTLGFVFLIGRKRNLRRTGMVSGLLVLAMVSGLASCGGGGGTATQTAIIPSTTPAGTTAIVVSAKGTATAGASPANPSQQLSISITVQP